MWLLILISTWHYIGILAKRLITDMCFEVCFQQLFMFWLKQQWQTKKCQGGYSLHALFHLAGDTNSCIWHQYQTKDNWTSQRCWSSDPLLVSCVTILHSHGHLVTPNCLHIYEVILGEGKRLMTNLYAISKILYI